MLFPDTHKKWRVMAVPVQPGSFQSRKALPEPWRGVRDEEVSASGNVAKTGRAEDETAQQRGTPLLRRAPRTLTHTRASTLPALKEGRHSRLRLCPRQRIHWRRCHLRESKWWKAKGTPGGRAPRPLHRHAPHPPPSPFPTTHPQPFPTRRAPCPWPRRAFTFKPHLRLTMSK